MSGERVSMICADPDDPKDYKQSFQERTHHYNENIVFGHFFGVRGAAQGGSMAQNILYLIVYKRCSESVGCVVVEGGRRVMYTIEKHLFHPAKGAPQKRDVLPRKRGTLLVPLLRCPPSILMGNGGGTPPPPSLFTGAHFGFHLITEWSAGPFIHLLSHSCPKIAFNRTTGRSVNL